ncbi:MAG: protein translocase subunit SecF [Acidobacteriota bacterium]
MEFLRDTHIDFMKYRKYFMIVSVVLIVVSFLTVFVFENLNMGIDFAGGTQVTIKFKQHPEIDELRSLMSEAGIAEPVIQQFGTEDANEALIKTSTVAGQEEGSQSLVLAALDSRYNASAQNDFDLNQRGSDALADLLFSLDPDELRLQDEEVARNHYVEVAQAVLEVRRQDGILETWDSLASVPAVSDEALDALKENSFLGDFAVLGVESVGPQIGSELRRRGVWAVVWSLVGMLGYITFRFELRYGVGALVAVIHDVLVVLGLFSLARFEFNLTTIAGFLTLVGYSVNDTVVVFDRVRENLRRSRRDSLVTVVNTSLNQTLSRTLLTSGTTLLTVGSLLFLGGDVLRGAAFILTVGIIVGTYSSIYVASPFALLWEHLVVRRRQKAA